MRTGACVIVPARLESTRFPRKVLASETGTPLIVHVLRRAERAKCADRVVVATDSDEIVRAVESAGFQAVMTAADHPNGTSRLAEAAERLGLGPDEIVINVQGDEPEISPPLIDAAAAALLSRGTEMATVVSPFGTTEDAGDPGVVKAVLRGVSSEGDVPVGEAVYFSRALVPHQRDAGGPAPTRYKHVGLYAYRAAFLQRYIELPPSPLEVAESLEQLRAIEHGVRIAAAVVAFAHAGVDTPQDYEAFVRRERDRASSGGKN